MAWPEQIFKWLGYGQYRSSLPTAASDGGSVPLLTDAYGRQRVVVDAASGSGSYATYTHTGLIYQAQVKESAGTVRQIVVTNTDTASDAWFAMFNLATMPGLTPEDLDAVTTILVVPAGETVSLPFEADVTYANGIAFMAFTTAELDTEFAAKLKVHILYTLPARAP